MTYWWRGEDVSKKFHNTIKLTQRTSVLLLLVSGKKQDNDPFSSLKKIKQVHFSFNGQTLLTHTDGIWTHDFTF